MVAICFFYNNRSFASAALGFLDSLSQNIVLVFAIVYFCLYSGCNCNGSSSSSSSSSSASSPPPPVSSSSSSSTNHNNNHHNTNHNNNGFLSHFSALDQVAFFASIISIVLFAFNGLISVFCCHNDRFFSFLMSSNNGFTFCRIEHDEIDLDRTALSTADRAYVASIAAAPPTPNRRVVSFSPTIVTDQPQQEPHVYDRNNINHSSAIAVVGVPVLDAIHHYQNFNSNNGGYGSTTNENNNGLVVVQGLAVPPPPPPPEFTPLASTSDRAPLLLQNNNNGMQQNRYTVVTATPRSTSPRPTTPQAARPGTALVQTQRVASPNDRIYAAWKKHPCVAFWRCLMVVFAAVVIIIMSIRESNCIGSCDLPSSGSFVPTPWPTPSPTFAPASGSSSYYPPPTPVPFSGSSSSASSLSDVVIVHHEKQGGRKLKKSINNIYDNMKAHKSDFDGAFYPPDTKLPTNLPAKNKHVAKAQNFVKRHEVLVGVCGFGFALIVTVIGFVFGKKFHDESQQEHNDEDEHLIIQ